MPKATLIVAYNMLFKKIFIAFLLTAILAVFTISIEEKKPVQQDTVLASREFSLDQRYPVHSVSEVFKDNILLTMAYLRGSTKSSNIDWEKVQKPFSYDLELRPGEVFAFHDKVLPEYHGKTIVTTNSHFNLSQGFKSDGYLVGDGVCHLASLIKWAAQDAKLEVKAPANHDFANIPEVPKEHGVSIYYMPGNDYTSETQNLYITNNKQKPIVFKFVFDGSNLKVTVDEVIS